MAGTGPSPRLALSLIRRLPEGSHYAAALTSAPDAEGVPTTKEPAPIDPALEARIWNQDRVLMAQLINSVNTLVRHLIPWEQGKAPTLPLIGPAAWRGEGPKKPAKNLSVMDVFKKIAG